MRPVSAMLCHLGDEFDARFNSLSVLGLFAVVSSGSGIPGNGVGMYVL